MSVNVLNAVNLLREGGVQVRSISYGINQATVAGFAVDQPFGGWDRRPIGEEAAGFIVVARAV